jgi:hypothetical protein
MVRAPHPVRAVHARLTIASWSLVAASLAPLAAHAQVPRRPPPATRPRPAVRPRATTPPAAPPTPPTPEATPPAPDVAAPIAAPIEPPREVIEPPRVERPAPPIAPTAPRRPVALDAQLGVRMFARDQRYTDDLFQRLRPYRVVGVPSLSAAVEFYPGALFTSGAASWFGVVLAADFAPYLTSGDAQGRTYPTTVYGVTAGARARYTFWRAEVGLTVAYTRQEFSIDRGAVDQAPPEGIPSVTYESLRVAASGRVQLVPRVAVMARGGYLATLGFGELGGDDFFPRASGGGVEAGAGAAVSIVGGLEGRLDLDWRRYFLSMNPVVGDRLVAGGSADDFYSATLSVAYRR